MQALPGDAVTSLRVDLSDGDERFDDLLLGPRQGPVAPNGDLVIRDRAGNWTYGFSVVVDDARQSVDLVVRGADLVDETPRQIRLAQRLGRAGPPRFLHHPLIHKPGGAKLSKSDGDRGVRHLRDAGWTATAVRAEAARLGRIPERIVRAASTDD